MEGGLKAGSMAVAILQCWRGMIVVHGRGFDELLKVGDGERLCQGEIFVLIRWLVDMMDGSERAFV
jgi:hypothetical protein